MLCTNWNRPLSKWKNIMQENNKWKKDNRSSFPLVFMFKPTHMLYIISMNHKFYVWKPKVKMIRIESDVLYANSIVQWHKITDSLRFLYKYICFVCEKRGSSGGEHQKNKRKKNAKMGIVNKRKCVYSSMTLFGGGCCSCCCFHFFFSCIDEKWQKTKAANDNGNLSVFDFE